MVLQRVSHNGGSAWVEAVRRGRERRVIDDKETRRVADQVIGFFSAEQLQAEHCPKLRQRRSGEADRS